jgi:hypothetical protein
VPHAGGGVALMLRRLDGMWAAGRLPATLTQPPSTAFDGIYFDTATTEPAAITAAATVLGAGCLVFGSDYPLGGSDDITSTAATIVAALGQSAADEICWRDVRGFGHART